MRKLKRHHYGLIGLAFIVLLIISIWLFRDEVTAPEWTYISQSDVSTPEVTTAQPAFDKSMYSIDDPASLWFIVNKQRPAPASYTPGNLRQPNVRVRSSGSSEMLLRDEAASAVEQLVSAASAAGINLMLVSGYRSYNLQQAVYAGNVAREGQANADKTSARPGHSEHQTGLAADLGGVNRICELETCFGQTPEGRWLAEHAHEYGFVIRYPEGKEAIVGYTYEPWHLRYVGKELSPEIQKTGQVLEQFFGLPNAASY